MHIFKWSFFLSERFRKTHARFHKTCGNCIFLYPRSIHEEIKLFAPNKKNYFSSQPPLMVSSKCGRLSVLGIAISEKINWKLKMKLGKTQPHGAHTTAERVENLKKCSKDEIAFFWKSTLLGPQKSEIWQNRMGAF